MSALRERDVGLSVRRRGLQRGSRRRSTERSSSAVDFGAFVARYQRLLELLSPLHYLADAVLYIVRWHNYTVTLSVVTVLCCLMYHPAILLILLTILATVLMFVGKHYGPMQAESQKKMRRLPKVNYIDQDQEALEGEHKEQKNSHQVLVEYKQIIKSADNFIATLTHYVEHIHSIVLWKSPEVSLCVTVLLIVFAIVLVMFGLRTILAILPLIILCSNRHFLNRTVLVWRRLWQELYTRYMSSRRELFQPDTQPGKQTVPVTDPRHHENTYSHPVRVPSEVASHNEAAAATVEAAPPAPGLTAVSSTDSLVAKAEPVNVDTGTDSDDQLAVIGSRPWLTSGTSAGEPTGGGGTREGGAPSENDGVGRGGASRKDTKGFCWKCNTSFAKLLKRKHDCNYCGQCYCGSCTVKVKRALLGATSPAAQEESVRVCLDCRYKLEDLKIAVPGVADT